jgi:hypothetical protein
MGNAFEDSGSKHEFSVKFEAGCERVSTAALVAFDHSHRVLTMYLKAARRPVVQLVALTFIAILAATESSLMCSCSLETTDSGITSVAYPNTNATYWTMPVNTAPWKGLQIKSTYPHARFTSFVVYKATGSVVQINGKEQNLNDIKINPDASNLNPFRQDVVPGQPQNYTIHFAASPLLGPTNSLQFGNSRLAWIIYRIYVRNKEQLGPNKILVDRQAGVPQPTVSRIDRGGAAHTLPACPSPKGSRWINQLPPDASWLLWARDVNILAFRNMLPDPAFSYSVQAVIAKTATDPNCLVPNEQGIKPTLDQIQDGADCAKNVMQE